MCCTVSAYLCGGEGGDVRARGKSSGPDADRRRLRRSAGPGPGEGTPRRAA